MSTTTAEDYRQELRHLAQGDPYEHIRAAEHYVEQVPDNHEHVLLLAMSYLKLGLGHPARERLVRLPDDMCQVPDIRAVFEMLKDVPDGRADMDPLNRRFKRNLAVLVRRCGELEEIESLWQQHADNFEFYRSNDRRLHIARIDANGSRHWWPYLADHVQLARQRDIPDLDAEFRSPSVMAGIDHGWYLRRVYETSERTFLSYSAALYVLEPDLLNLALFLHTDDWSKILGDPRVGVFAGERCAEALRDMLIQDEHAALPQYVLPAMTCRPNFRDSVRKMLEGVLNHRNELYNARLQEAEQIYADRDAAYWAKRYDAALNGSGPPLRIFATVSRQTTFLQHSMRDCRAAFEALGCEFELLIEDNDRQCYTPANFVKPICKHRPDLVIFIDHNRHEYGDSIHRSIPYVSFIQDILPDLFSPDVGEKLNERSYCMGIGKAEAVFRWGYPKDRFLPCIIPTNENVYSAEPLSAEELAPYRCQVSYVSNASATAEDLLKQQCQADPASASFYKDLYDWIVGHFEGGRFLIDRLIVDRVRSACTAFMDPQTATETALHLRQLFAVPICNLIYRQQVLEWLAEMGVDLHLYGRGWDKHPRLHKHARGVAANGPELRAIYQASNINLQVSVTGAVHQRLLDGLASGGFFLLRYHPGDVAGPRLQRVHQFVQKAGITSTPSLLECTDGQIREDIAWLQEHTCRPAPEGDETYVEYLDILAQTGFALSAGAMLPHYEEVMFRTRAELVEKVAHFLKEPDLRESIAEEQRRAVLSEHTYSNLMRRLLEFIRADLHKQAERSTSDTHAPARSH